MIGDNGVMPLPVYQDMRNKLKSVKSKCVRSLCSSFGIPHRNARKDDAIAKIDEFIEQQYLLKNFNLLYSIKDIINLALSDKQIPILSEYIKLQDEKLLSQIVVPSKNDLQNISSNRSNNDDLYISLFRKSHFYKFKKTITPDSGYPILTVKSNLKRRNTTRINFTLNKSEVDLIKNFNYSVYLFCGTLDDDRTDKIIYFPYPSNVECNGIATHANTKGIKNKHGTTNPVNLSKFLKFDQTNRLTIVYRESDEQTFEFYLYLVEEVSIEKIESKVLDKSHIPKEDTIKLLNGDGDLQLSSESVQLLCPCSFVRIVNPVRSLSCKHVQCFDLSSFLNLQQKIPTWECPVCSEPILLKNLRVDDYFKLLLTEIDENFDFAIVKSDGSFVPKLVGTDTEYKTVSKDLDGVTSNNFATDIKMEENIVIKHQEVGVVDLTSKNIKDDLRKIDYGYPNIPLAEGEEDDDDEEALIIPSKIKHSKKIQPSNNTTEATITQIEHEVIVLDSDTDEEMDVDQTPIVQPESTQVTQVQDVVSNSQKPQVLPADDISTPSIIENVTTVDKPVEPTSQIVGKQSNELLTDGSNNISQMNSEPLVNSMGNLNAPINITIAEQIPTEYHVQNDTTAPNTMVPPTKSVNVPTTQNNGSASTSTGVVTEQNEIPVTSNHTAQPINSAPGKIVFKKVGPVLNQMEIDHPQPDSVTNVNSDVQIQQVGFHPQQDQPQQDQLQSQSQPQLQPQNEFHQQSQQQSQQSHQDQFFPDVTFQEILKKQIEVYKLSETLLKSNIDHFNIASSNENEYKRHGIQIPRLLSLGKRNAIEKLIELNVISNLNQLQAMRVVCSCVLKDSLLSGEYLKTLLFRIDKYASFEEKFEFFLQFQNRRCFNLVMLLVNKFILKQIDHLLTLDINDLVKQSEGIANILSSLSLSFTSPSPKVVAMFKLGLIKMHQSLSNFNCNDFLLKPSEAEHVKIVENQISSFDLRYSSSIYLSFDHFSKIRKDVSDLEARKTQEKLKFQNFDEKNNYVATALNDWIHTKFVHNERLANTIEEIAQISRKSLTFEMKKVSENARHKFEEKEKVKKQREQILNAQADVNHASSTQSVPSQDVATHLPFIQPTRSTTPQQVFVQPPTSQSMSPRPVIKHLVMPQRGTSHSTSTKNIDSDARPQKMDLLNKSVIPINHGIGNSVEKPKEKNGILNQNKVEQVKKNIFGNEQNLMNWVLNKDSSNNGINGEKISAKESKEIFDKQWQIKQMENSKNQNTASEANRVDIGSLLNNQNERKDLEEKERIRKENEEKDRVQKEAEERESVRKENEERDRIQKEAEEKSRKEVERSRIAREAAEKVRIIALDKVRIEKEETERKVAEERVRIEKLRRQSIEKSKIEAAAKARADREAAKIIFEREEAVKAKAQKEATERAEKEAADKLKAEQEAVAKAKSEREAAVAKAKAEKEAADKLKAEQEAVAKANAEKEAAAKAYEQKEAMRLEAEEIAKKQREASAKRMVEEKARIQRAANEREAMERIARIAKEVEVKKAKEQEEMRLKKLEEMRLKEQEKLRLKEQEELHSKEQEEMRLKKLEEIRLKEQEELHLKEQVQKRIKEAEEKARELSKPKNFEREKPWEEAYNMKNKFLEEKELKTKKESRKLIIEDAGNNRESPLKPTIKSLLPPLPPPSYSPPPSSSTVKKKKNVKFMDEIEYSDSHKPHNPPQPYLPISKQQDIPAKSPESQDRTAMKIPSKTTPVFKTKYSAAVGGDQELKMNQLRKLVAEGKQRKAEKEKKVGSELSGISKSMSYEPANSFAKKVSHYRESFLKVKDKGPSSNKGKNISNENDLCKSIEEISRAKIENDLAGRSNDVRKRRYNGIDEFSHSKNNIGNSNGSGNNNNTNNNNNNKRTKL